MIHIKLFEAFNDQWSWKEYFDILSVKYSVGGDDFRLIGPDHPEFEDCVLDCVESGWKEDEIEIYSVRRKEDGEIFTLGLAVFYVSLDVKNFGIADKIWPSLNQMRVDIGNVGFPLNDKFFMSSTILDLKVAINESKKIDSSEWLDLIKKYQCTSPSIGEFRQIKSIADEYGVDCVFGHKDLAGNRSVDIISPRRINILIWKLEDDYWTVWTNNNPKFNSDGESYYICDQLDELLDLIREILKV